MPIFYNDSSGSKLTEKIAEHNWNIGPECKELETKLNCQPILIGNNFKNSILVEIWISRLWGHILCPKVACNQYPVFPVLSSGSQNSQASHFNLELVKNQELLSASTQFKVVDTTYENSNLSTNFKIEQGSFYETIIPETAESLWGPVLLGKLEKGKENICKAVSHK